MSKNKKLLILLITFFALSTICTAQVLPPAPLPVPPALIPPALFPTIKDPSIITNAFEQMTVNWLASIQIYLGALFAALAACDVTWFLVQLKIKGHGMESAIMAVTGKIVAIGFFYTLLLNGPIWMPEIINTFIGIGRVGSGLSSLGPSEILTSGMNIAGSLMAQGVEAAATADFVGAAAIFAAVCAVWISFTVMTLQFIIAQVDIYLAFSVGQVCLALGGSKWTVPYVERYFSYCVAAGIKMMAIYLLVGATQFMTITWLADAKVMGGTDDSALSGLILASAVFIMCFVVYHSAKFISSVLGGAPNMTGSDFMAFMMPAAVASVGLAGVAANVIGAGAPSAAAAATGAMASGAASAAGAATDGMGSTQSPSEGSGGSSGMAPSYSPSGGAMGTIASGAHKVANVGLSAVRSMPSGGSMSHPPPLKGVDH